MYCALLQAFQRHRIKGGVLDVWEHLTTKRCHKCHEKTKPRCVPWSNEDVEREKKRLTEHWEVLCREAEEAEEAEEEEENNEEKPTLKFPSDEELFKKQKRGRRP